MIRLVESFREFLDLAKINQGPDGWTIYGANPKKKKPKSRRPRLQDHTDLEKKDENLSENTPN
jgi:hypothetical protein